MIRAALFFLMAAQAAGRDDAARRLDLFVSLDCRDVPLQAVLDRLHEETGLEFVAQEGGERRVSVTLHEISARSVLKLVLHPLGLSAALIDGRIVVRSSRREPVETRVYDVRHVLIRLLDFPSPGCPRARLLEPQLNIVCVYCFDPGEFNEGVLADLIRESTGGRSWDRDLRMSLSWVRGRIVVCQTASVHRDIEGLLALFQFRDSSLPRLSGGD